MNYILEEIVKSNLFIALGKDLLYQVKCDDKSFLVDYYSKQSYPLEDYLDGICKIDGGYILNFSTRNYLQIRFLIKGITVSS